MNHRVFALSLFMGLPLPLGSLAAQGISLPDRAGLLAVPTEARPAPPPPDPRGSLTLSVENDVFSGTDRFYTNGLQLAWRSPSLDLPAPLAWVDRQLDRLVGPGAVRWGFGLSHAIYTPQDTATPTPDPTDRPYAGHLFGALVLQRDEGHALTTIEFQAGVVGPSALGEFVQNNYHDRIRVQSANGWDRQLKDEPALGLVFERIARSGSLRLGGLEADMLPAVTLALGNVSTYAATGVAFRLGQGLEADYGVPRIRPGLVGSSFFQPRVTDAPLGWYVFGGVQGRAVARDLFLDGNTWRNDGPSVERRELVGDASAGIAVHWRGVRLAFSQVWRTQEFYGQRGGIQSFGSLGMTLRF